MKQISRNGEVLENSNGQDKILGFLYGNALGRCLLKPLVHPWVSRVAGRLLSTRASCLLISPFIRSNHIDMSQFEDVPYRSYSEFFSRKIRPSARPIDPDPNHLISPCDSKLTALPITEDLRVTLKHTEYSVASLLSDDTQAKAYQGGTALIFRLTVDDYHRYCYCAEGTKGVSIRIPGRLHTVNPIANDYFPIYKENTREYTILQTAEFGDILIMEVGALLVGKIVNHREKAQVQRGQEKGYFQFGGSTIVMLMQKDTAQIDADILENSRNGWETLVKMGEKIGISSKA